MWKWTKAPYKYSSKDNCVKIERRTVTLKSCKKKNMYNVQENLEHSILFIKKYSSAFLGNDIALIQFFRIAFQSKPFYHDPSHLKVEWVKT